MVDEPTVGGYYGGQVAAPVFSTIVSETLRSLNVTPDMNERTVVQAPDAQPITGALQKVALKQ
jgi:cell division protein FtsI (penicillin-binding protein 3)